MSLWDLLTTEGKKYIQDAMPGGALNPEVTTQGLLDTAAIASAPVPVVGDIIGLTADAKRLYENPEERTPTNIGLSALGVLPFMPSLGTIKNVTKAPRMSAAEAKAAGYWHDIGAGKKLPIPVGEMRAEREVVRNLEPHRIISPESMQGGAIVPLSGDRSIAGQILTGVGDVKFNTPVALEGGPDFMRTHSPTGYVWASDKGPITGLMNRAKEAQELAKGGDVYGVYNAMGHGSMNFNTMMSDALLEQMKAGKISKKNIAAFDREVRAIRPEWAGVMSDQARQQLESNGALRHVFVDRMQLDKFKEAGFPDISYTRYALTEPSLLDVPLHSSGFAISKIDPQGAINTAPLFPHKTYSTQMPGQYVGGLLESIPRDIMFPDWYAARRAAGALPKDDARSFMLSNPVQQANQQWLDGIMQYLGR